MEVTMAKFCRYCGSPVREESRFCGACGKPIVEVESQAGTQPRIKPESSAASRKSTAAQKPGSAKKSVSSQKKNTAQKAQTTKAKAVMKPQIREVTAAAAAGEIDCGNFSFAGFDTLDAQIPGVSAAKVSEVLSPVSGILQAVGSFIGGIMGVLKNPKALIETAVLAVLWFVLGMLRNSDSGILKFLSWLTFAEGGFDRSAFGTVGGILGKGTVAAALVSLFSGGLKDAFRGIGALITGHGEKRSIFSIIFGILIGGAVYIAFAGADNASGATAMPGIAGIILSLEALGGSSGKLYELAQNLTSRAVNGVRTAAKGKCEGLLTGLTIGFALATVLSALL